MTDRTRCSELVGWEVWQENDLFVLSTDNGIYKGSELEIAKQLYDQELITETELGHIVYAISLDKQKHQ